MSSCTSSPHLPLVLAGPILRRLEPHRLTFWLVATEPVEPVLELDWNDGGARVSRELAPEAACRRVRVGRHAWIHGLDVRLDEALPEDVEIGYDLRLGQAGGVAQWAPHLVHPGRERPSFVLRSRLDDILFGSCRKPHYASRDGLARADAVIAGRLGEPASRPACLMLCGDQVYADDVAGPMLTAIHALVRALGLYGEHLEGAVVGDSEALYAHAATYYRREDLLPAFRSNEALRERFFGGVEKPVFTTASAHNHLVTLAEVMAMYLLAWSPVAWRLAAAPMPALEPAQAARYRAEEAALAGFRECLPQAARAMAHVQTLMIFDDHDITDDWNLSARWELTAYGHPFSRRIVGNALIGYALCQAWGNDPDALDGPMSAAAALADGVDAAGRLDCAAQNALIDALLRFGQWHYALPTTPPLIVLDTRTHRWRSEHYLSRPSGLMDWEALSELQQQLLDKPSAVIVSPAPMFGVKLIEVIQRIMSWAGHALMVDAENWMAHRGAASVMLNIFRHSRTPGNYVVLSGDVHYSFVYDIRLRHRERGPRIWQVTSSGLKNEFPRRLLDWLDRVNRWLYAPRSPLNRLTKRRHMEIVPRVPDRRRAGERVWNGAGVGEVWLDERGVPVRAVQHNADGSPPTAFLVEEADEAEAVADEARARGA